MVQRPRNSKGRLQDIPGTYENIRNRTTNREQKEANIWGRVVKPEMAELRADMWNRFPGIKQYHMPREVADRIDIDLSAKMVYSFLSNFPTGVRVTRSEIGGMCGLSLYQVAKGIYDLKAAGLLEVKEITIRSEGKKKKIHMPPWYCVITPPKRLINKEPPAWTKTDISDLQEIIDGYFYET